MESILNLSGNAIVLHPDRDGILSSAILARLLGPAANYIMANARKLVPALRLQRANLIENGYWPVERLLVVDLPASADDSLPSELARWHVAGTQIWFLDHHPWQAGTFMQLRPFLALGHPEYQDSKEKQPACGRLCCATFAAENLNDPRIECLMDMIYNPNQMEQDSFAEEWYPVIDAAARVCRPGRLGYAALGWIIEGLAEGSKVPDKLESVRLDQLERNRESTALAQSFVPEMRTTAKELKWFCIDLRSHPRLNPIQITLALKKRLMDVHFCTVLLRNQIKCSRYAAGAKQGLDLRTSIQMDNQSFPFLGHDYAVTTDELGSGVDLPMLAQLHADVTLRG